MSRSSLTSRFRHAQLEERARSMRHAPTCSEARLFEAIRGARLGVSFKRQVPLLGRFIVDLLAPAVKLVVEVDGGYHEERVEADARKERALVRAGYTVLRLDAALIVSDLDAAVALVAAEVARLQGTRHP